MQKTMLQTVHRLSMLNWCRRAGVASSRLQTGIRSNYVRQITNGSISTSNVDATEIKPFEEIPGPKSLPYIGTLYKYLPFGEYSFKKVLKTGMNRYSKFGPIVREEIFPGIFQVHLYDPEDIAVVYRNEGPHPIRPEIFGLKMYRDAKGMSQGLINLNGEAWQKVRSPAQKRMMKKTSAVDFIPVQNPVSEEFIKHIRLLRDKNGEVPDFLNELYKWAMESIGVVCFDSRLGTLNVDLAEDSEAAQLIKAINRAFRDLYTTTMMEGYFRKKPDAPTMLRLFEDMDTIVRQEYEDIVLGFE